MREVDTAFIQRATVVADTLAGVRAEAGDLIIPRQEGAIGPDHVRAELGQVLLGQAPSRTSADQITAFESVGAAFEDAVTARLAYERALARGVGARFAFW
jgi:ornithine cyclodeaminase/alanine dehydrogenase